MGASAHNLLCFVLFGCLLSLAPRAAVMSRRLLSRGKNKSINFINFFAFLGHCSCCWRKTGSPWSGVNCLIEWKGKKEISWLFEFGGKKIHNQQSATHLEKMEWRSGKQINNQLLFLLKWNKINSLFYKSNSTQPKRFIFLSGVAAAAMKRKEWNQFMKLIDWIPPAHWLLAPCGAEKGKGNNPPLEWKRVVGYGRRPSAQPNSISSNLSIWFHSACFAFFFLVAFAWSWMVVAE